MEKIQDAIAKARALRESQIAARQIPGQSAGQSAGQIAGQTPAMAAARDGAVLSPQVAVRGSDPGGMAEAEPNAHWADLPEFRPAPSTLHRHRIVTLNGGREAAECDAIRTRILQLQRANDWRRIAVTSPGPSCGKSTLVLNLAFSLARQRDQRTIVCEMDLRRPSLARMLGLREPQNLAAVLEGREPFEHNAVRIGQNLIVSTNSQSVPNPAELLQGDRAARALDDITARYAPTVMLFDLPPMLAVDDAMAFFARVDAVILVAAAEATTIKQIDTCEREIAGQTNVMGVVLNKCRYTDPEKSYGY
jgi:capsular exopolysaccharide synthesis family protein